MENNELSLPSGKINDGPRFMTIAELMKRTTLSRPTIYRHIKKGSIPAFRVGRRVLIDAAFLSQLKTQASSSSKEEKE
jgi:excisionase family DNA binding protein